MKLKGQPAILLGNGINRYKQQQNVQSWESLLFSLPNTNVEERKKITAVLKDVKGISYPDFFDALCFKSDETHETLKKVIADEVQGWKGENHHRKLLDFAMKNNIPILTTNYDLSLISEELWKKIRKITHRTGRDAHKPIVPKEKAGFWRYPFYHYYSDKMVANVCDEFAIWHMHGICCYPKSLIIGATDYGLLISNLKERLFDKKTNELLIDGDLKNSWIDIFFHKDLYVIGLALDSQETSLRWLLIQRMRYIRQKGLNLRTTYIALKGETSKGKNFFLSSIGISLKEVNAYSDIYDSWFCERLNSRNSIGSE